MQTLQSQQLRQLINVHIRTSDHDLKHVLSLHSLLTLLLELERNLVLTDHLDGLRAHRFASLLELLDVELIWIAEETNQVVVSDVENTLLLLLEVSSELGQEGDVDSGVGLVTLNEVGVSLIILQQVLDLEGQNLHVLLLCHSGETLELMEESVGGLIDLILVNTPGLA